RSSEPSPGSGAVRPSGRSPWPEPYLSSTVDMRPETKYARSGDVHIAYQVAGEGPIDLLFVPSWISQAEQYWEEPTVARFFERLTAFSRLIMFDRRGTGMSDPLPRAPTLEEQIDDVVAV